MLFPSRVLNWVENQNKQTREVTTVERVDDMQTSFVLAGFCHWEPYTEISMQVC